MPYNIFSILILNSFLVVTVNEIKNPLNPINWFYEF